MEQRKRSRVVEVGFVAALMVVAAMVVAGPGAHALHGPTGAGVTAAAHLSATPTAKPNPVDVGQSTTVSAGAAGGSGTYTSYVWAGLPSSCATPGNVASFPCVPTVAGTYVVSVTVTDSAGSHATGKFTLTVDPALNAGTTSASVNPADVGQATTIATSGASGGSGRYTYAWTGLPAGCSSTAASFRCTPTAAGGFTVTLTVTDGNHATAVSSFALTIDAKLVVAASASVNPVDSKTPTTISAAASGGSGTYPSYVWSGALPTGCAFPTGTTTTSFGCTPTHTGSFTIKVAVTDSNKNTVTGSFALKVDASLTVTPTAKPNPVDLGQTTTVSAGATGGSGTYTSYVWSGTAPSGCSLPAGTTTSSFPCSPTSPGSYVLSVTVRDSTGNAVSNSVTLKVDPALVVSPSARPDPADVGQATTISAGASGGSGTYLSYAWSGAVPSGCTLPTGTGTRSFSCTPGSTGTFPITVTVKDSTGNSVTNSVTLTVDPALSPGTVAANPNPLDAGQATTISTTGASGGAGPYTYAWTGLPPGCSTPGSVASFVCTPSVGGTYPVRLTVTDANSATAKATVTLTVSTSLSAGTVSATPSPLDVGQSTTIATTGGSGGAAPYTYAWSGLPPGCPTPGNVSSFACAPTASGMFTVLLVVSDAYANMVGTTLSLVVDPPLGAGTITASPNPADLGQTVYLFASGGSGGTGSGTYAYLWSGLPAGCAAPGNVTSFACAPTASGTSVVQLQVTDGNGAAATTTVSLTVSPAISAELSAAPPVTQVGGSVVLTVTIVGGAPPVTWTLTMNGSSMNLSGVADNAYTFTPPATGTYTFYLNATDASGTPSNTTIVVTVEPALTATLSAAPPETQVGETSVLSLGFTGGVPPVTWTLEEGGSPANLSGVVAGVYDFTPTVPGAFTFYLNASDAVGSASLTTATVVVEPALLVTLSASPATTQVGGISAVTVGVSGGVPPIAWTLFLGATNVTAAASSGTYTFAPGAPGTYTFYLNATDAVGSQSRATASVVVAPALAATLSASPSTTQVGAAATLTAGTSGGVPPIAWTLSVDGAIVANGSANGSYVFVPAVAGTYTFYLNATDAVGSVSNVTATVLVEPALSASLSATPATTDVGVPSVVTLGLSRGVAPYVWTLTMVYLGPTNITGSVVDGSYTLLPTAVGTYWFYLNATDAVGSVANATATVVVEPTLATSLSASPTTTQVGGSSLLTLGISGGAGPVAWTLYLGGANLTSSVLYRTYDFVAGAAGSYTFYLNATDAVGIASSATVTVVVVPALVATLSASPPVTQVGAGCVIALGFTGGVAPIGWTLWIGGTNITADVTGGSYSFLPTAAGTYVFFLNATDAVGSTSGATVIVTVEPALVASLSADRGSIDVGQSLTLTLGGSDGVPPYAWTLEMNGSSANLSGVAGETYRFTPSGPGTYTFYLNVTDRVGSTSSATVVVTVEPALAVGTVSAVPNPLDVGQSATIATTGATGGTGSYTYVWTGLPPGCPDPGNVTSFACAPSIGGVYAVLVTVTDGNGASATGGVSVLVSSVLSVGAPLAAPNPVDAGQTATLSTTGASGGTGPYTYLWTGLPPGCPNPGNVTSFACAPSSAGTFTVLLTVTDSAGNSAGVTLTLVVDPALSAGTLVATRTTLDVGQPTSVSTSGVGGGLAPYTYAWTGLPTGCANPGDTSAFGCAPTAAGTFDVQLLVTDANGASATASIVLTVDPPLLVVPTASLNPVHVGQTTTLFAGASGGSGVYTTYLWSAPPQLGCLLGTTASISCTPTVTGTFTLSVSATDSNGATATGALAVTAVAVVPGVYTVTVSGGPSGHVWYLNLSNGQTFQSSGPALNFTEPNGTYGYEFGGTVVGSRVLSALPGTFVVQGGPVNLQPSFVPCRGVVLIEKGLPPGMEWWANFTGGYPFFSFGTTMALFLPPGTWAYTLHATNPDYAVRGHTLTVKGPITKILKPTRYTLKFKLETFVVRFTETGLPPGSRWCVVMKGLGTFCGRGGQVHFRAPNGTYSYSLTTTAVGFSGAGGTIVVHGPGTQPVSFSTTGGGLPAVGPAAPRSASSRSSGLSAVLVALGAVAGLGVGAMGRRGRSEVGPGAG